MLTAVRLKTDQDINLCLASARMHKEEEMRILGVLASVRYVALF